MSFVLDASVALSWCFADEASAEAFSLLDQLKTGDQAFVPAIWPLEIGNILIAAERKKRLTYAEVVQFLELIAHLDIQIDGNTAKRAFHETLTLAHLQQLTTYDASYLELAMRLGLPLATKDKQIHKAANNLGVKLLRI